MSEHFYPIDGLGDGSVPADQESAYRSARPARGRFRRVAAGVAIGLSLAAGGVAVAQIPLHGSNVGTVFSATQNPDNDSPAAEPEEPAPAPAPVTGTHEED